MRSAVDKRRHRRVAGAGLNARVRFDGAAHQPAVLENVSLGGALLGLAQPLAPGKNLVVELLRESGQVVRLVGRVIACTPPGRGRSCASTRVRFNPLTPAATERLYELISDLSGEFSIEVAVPSDPEEFEFHERPAPEDDEPLPLLEEVTDASMSATVSDASEATQTIVMGESLEPSGSTEVVHLAQLLRVREARIVELVRELEAARRRTRTLEELLPAAPH
jgi:hypothetical protein